MANAFCFSPPLTVSPQHVRVQTDGDSEQSSSYHDTVLPGKSACKSRCIATAGTARGLFAGLFTPRRSALRA